MRHKLIVLLLIVTVFLSGCGNVYLNEPDIEDRGGREQDEDEEILTDSAEDTSGQTPTGGNEGSVIDDETTVAATADPVTDSTTDSTTDTTTDTSADTHVPVVEYDEALFVNQFSSDEPYTLDVDLNELDGTDEGWSFKRNADHAPVTGYYNIDLSLFGAYFIEKTEEQVVYLTFDEGYEYGFTPKILDVLKDNNVKATFFITGDFINRQPELVQRMVDEGHTVGNHSENHKNMTTLTSDEVYEELNSVAQKFEELTGQTIAPFFRTPSGRYSEQLLYLVRKLGYRTIFWSMAHKDWETANQPGQEVAYNHVMDNYHNGSIILLHAVSESNTEALDDILKDLKALGYRFGSLYELE